jgi:hypothetical protein
LASFGKKTDDI